MTWIIGAALRKPGIPVAALDLDQALQFAEALRERVGGDMAWAVPMTPENASRFLSPACVPESVAA